MPRIYILNFKLTSDVQSRQFQARAADEGRIGSGETEICKIVFELAADHPQEEVAPLVVCQEFNLQTRQLGFRQKGGDLKSHQSCSRSNERASTDSCCSG